MGKKTNSLIGKTTDRISGFTTKSAEKVLSGEKQTAPKRMFGSAYDQKYLSAYQLFQEVKIFFLLKKLLISFSRK